MVYMVLQKDKAIPVHAMEAGKGSGGIVPLIHKLDTRLE